MMPSPIGAVTGRRRADISAHFRQALGSKKLGLVALLLQIICQRMILASSKHYVTVSKIESSLAGLVLFERLCAFRFEVQPYNIPYSTRVPRWIRMLGKNHYACSPKDPHRIERTVKNQKCRKHFIYTYIYMCVE